MIENLARREERTRTNGVVSVCSEEAIEWSQVSFRRNEEPPERRDRLTSNSSKADENSDLRRKTTRASQTNNVRATREGNWMSALASSSRDVAHEVSFEVLDLLRDRRR